MEGINIIGPDPKDPVELSKGVFYSPEPGKPTVIPFRHAVIPWVQRSDQFRRAAEITVENTDIHKPWEAVFFLLHRATEYVLKAYLLHNDPNCEVKKYGHRLSKLIEACVSVDPSFPELNEDQVRRLMHFEKERYPNEGWNYAVGGGDVKIVSGAIMAVRDLLGGKGFVFSGSC